MPQLERALFEGNQLRVAYPGGHPKASQLIPFVLGGGTLRKVLTLAKYASIPVPTDDMTSPLLRMRCRPEDINPVDVFAILLPAELLDANEAVFLLFNRLDVPVYVPILAAEKVANFSAAIIADAIRRCNVLGLLLFLRG
jgi:hypothetical protein